MNKKYYWVDLPNPNRTCDDDSWVNVKQYYSKGEAVTYLMENYGLRKTECSLFISEGEV